MAQYLSLKALLPQFLTGYNAETDLDKHVLIKRLNYYLCERSAVQAAYGDRPTSVQDAQNSK